MATGGVVSTGGAVATGGVPATGGTNAFPGKRDPYFAKQFKDDWGFDFSPQSRDVPFSRDMRKLFTALSVVDDNSAATPGGAGPRTQPLAPDFQ